MHAELNTLHRNIIHLLGVGEHSAFEGVYCLHIFRAYCTYIFATHKNFFISVNIPLILLSLLHVQSLHWVQHMEFSPMLFLHMKQARPSLRRYFWLQSFSNYIFSHNSKWFDSVLHKFWKSTSVMCLIVMIFNTLKSFSDNEEMFTNNTGNWNLEYIRQRELSRMWKISSS